MTIRIYKDFSSQARKAVVSRDPLNSEALDQAFIPAPKHDPLMPSGLHGFFGGVFRSDRAYVDLSRQTRVGVIPTVYPPPCPPGGPRDIISGKTLYAGALYNHYGHFLLESTARLWAAATDEIEHVVYLVSPGASERLCEFQRTFLAAAGLINKTIMLSEKDHGLTFDHLIVPEPAFEVEQKINREFAEIFRRTISKPAAGASLYLSRLNMQHGIVVGEEELQRLFVHLGFEVYFPEQHSLSDQMEKYCSVSRVAGVLGSALHNVLFMNKGVEVFNIIRSENAPLQSFYLTDRAVEAEAHYIDGIDFSAMFDFPDRGPPGPFVIDIGKVIDALRNIPSVDQRQLSSFRPSTSPRDVEYQTEWHLAEARALKSAGNVDDALKALRLAHSVCPRNEKVCKALAAAEAS